MRTRNKSNTSDSRLLDIQAAAEYLSLGLSTTRKVLQECGAMKKIGSRVLFDKKIIDEYVNKLSCNATNEK